MPSDLRFPLQAATAFRPSEANQIIPLLTNAIVLPAGSGLSGGDIFPWKLARPESPYKQIVIEFTATAQMTLNDGTAAQAIGVYGEIAEVGSRFLLGVLGYNLGAALPQIRIHGPSNGFAQIVNYAPIYDRLAVGGIFGDINVPGGQMVTVTARPIRERNYTG